VITEREPAPAMAGRTSRHRLFGLVFGLALCAAPATRPQAAPPQTPPEPARTASQVAQAIVTDCRERRWSEVAAVLHPTLRHTWLQIGYTVREYCDLITRDETLAEVRIVKEEREGPHTSVYLTFVYRDGSEKADRAGLLLDQGAWKLAD